MSSHDSPTLVLELRDARGQRIVALGLIALAGLASLLLFRDVSLVFLLFLAVLLLVALTFGFRRAGWLGGTRSVVRATWRGDGSWRVTSAAGAEAEGRLLPASRMSPVAIWLRWSIEAPTPTDARPGGRPWARTRTVLLLPGDLPAADFRRLLVRLRLDRSECAAPSAAQANS